MPKKRKIALIGLAITLCLIVGVGATYATRQLTKQEEMALKQQMKPEVPVGQRAVDMIGIFPPQFEESANSHLAMYEKEYGKGNVQIITYQGYTLIVPPNKTNSEDIEKVKTDIDRNVQTQQQVTPSSDIQDQDIKKIKEVFGVQENITYNSIIGAYVDERGYQYNFYKGELVNKQVGITPGLQQQWKEHYPYLAGLVTEKSVVTEDQARTSADGVIAKLFDADKVNELKSKAETMSVDDYRLLIVYGDNEVRFLLDKVSGDIIYYGKIK